MQTIDYIIIILFIILTISIGFSVSKRAGSSYSEYFLSGRNMPWWLLGFSMVATTTSTNTANLFTEIIRKDGISGNWVWWSFLLTGMLTVFVYAKLWHRSGVTTDIEFYELRYGGKIAAFLRGFRALYLGVIFNTIIMAWGILATVKISIVMFNITPINIMIIIGLITVTFSMVGGLRGILINDFIQFGFVMLGAFIAAFTALNMPEVGGLTNLLKHDSIVGKLNFFPDFSNTDLLVSVFIIPIAVQWWSVWYPGSEPGGGGYVVQRLLSAKDEKNSVGAAFLFNVIQYGLRPWPWFIVALCSIVIYPSLESLGSAFPGVDKDLLGNDMAYPAMLTFLKPGLLGLVVASLLSAFMSTMSTHLNLNSSYLVNDFYLRFINSKATDKQLVMVGRIVTVLLMIWACCIALFLQSAKRGFDIILQVGAGTGLLFILRWFWWRINAFSEITAMVVSFLVACYFEFIHPNTGMVKLEHWQKLIIGVVVTTFSWMIITLLTKPTNEKTLINFCKLVRAGGPGWKTVLNRADELGIPIQETNDKWDLPNGILCMVFASLGVYSTLFATGSWLYSYYIQAILLTLVAVISTLVMWKLWNRMYGKT